MKYAPGIRFGLTARILIVFLVLSVGSLAIVGFFANRNISRLGDFALRSSDDLGESAIQDSTAALQNLGEEIISQTARDVAKQVEIYLRQRTDLTLADLGRDEELRKIASQTVGITGYTAIVDLDTSVILVHKFPVNEGKSLADFRDSLPSLYAILEASSDGKAARGYYDWIEPDGSRSQKYAYVAPIEARVGGSDHRFTLWATTYITEFSSPVEETKRKIDASIAGTTAHINGQIKSTQNTFIVVFVVAILAVCVLAFWLARTISKPVLSLTADAQAMEKGELTEDEISRLSQNKGKDEVAALSRVFAKMAAGVKARETKLKKQVEELKIEIDHSKKARQVAEITDTDYFQTLKQKAKELRDKKEKEESD